MQARDGKVVAAAAVSSVGGAQDNAADRPTTRAKRERAEDALPSPHLRRAALAAALLAAPAPAFAEEIVASLGIDDLRGDRVAAAGLELRSDALWTRSRYGLGLGAAMQIDGDFWAGAGPVLTVALTPRWRLEASVMLGGYGHGDGDDLGAGFPMFRSLLGASYAIAERWRIGASIDHKSNARASDVNPGVETLMLTLSYAFRGPGGRE